MHVCIMLMHFEKFAIMQSVITVGPNISGPTTLCCIQITTQLQVCTLNNSPAVTVKKW